MFQKYSFSRKTEKPTHHHYVIRSLPLQLSGDKECTKVFLGTANIMGGSKSHLSNMLFYHHHSTVHSIIAAPCRAGTIAMNWEEFDICFNTRISYQEGYATLLPVVRATAMLPTQREPYLLKKELLVQERGHLATH